MLILLAAAAFAVPTHEQIESAAWKQVATRDHADAGTVTVYQANIGGMDCFRGTAVTPAPMDKLLEVATDVPSATKWSTAGLTKSEVLGKHGSTMEYWQYLDVPGWTMSSDRFWFVTGTYSSSATLSYLRWDELASGGAYGTKYSEVKATYPDAVETVVNIGGWYFKPDAGGTLVDYDVCTDPGGSIPAAVQSAATRRTLPDTVGDLIREAKHRAGL